MAIIDKNAHNWIDDSNENQSIGLTLPLLLDNGQIASTKTTLEAVKQNVLNLLNTEMGERVMQPNLGVMLKRFLFEPFSNEVVDNIGSVIVEAMNHWMPFVQINDIRVKMSDNESGDFKSTMEVSVDFSLKKDNNATDSVQVTIGE